MLDLQRKQEKTWMNQSRLVSFIPPTCDIFFFLCRLREETSIIQNIKKRELIEMKKKEMKPIIVKELKEVKKKSTIPLILIPSSDHKSNGKKRSIVSGLLGTRTILLAPTAAALIDPSEKKNARVTSTVTPPDPKQVLFVFAICILLLLHVMPFLPVALVGKRETGKLGATPYRKAERTSARSTLYQINLQLRRRGASGDKIH